MPPHVRQAAAVPVRDGRVCLVTSRNGRRWVIPKGRIDRGHTPGQAALVEAWEEAGLVGILLGEPAGTYLYEKTGLSHVVTVFVMEVTEEHEDWPERDERTREWVSLSVALGRIEEAGLRDILAGVLRAGQPAA